MFVYIYIYTYIYTHCLSKNRVKEKEMLTRRDIKY